jgi:hypothetical protein
VRARQVLGDLPPDSAQGLSSLALAGRRGSAHVFLGDATSRPCPLDRPEINAELGGDLADDRRRLDPFWLLAHDLAIADDHERSADRDELTLLDEDARDRPGRRRGDLDRRLVGLDLDERIVLGDRLADLDEPAGDLALADALAEIGELELVGQG